VDKEVVVGFKPQVFISSCQILKEKLAKKSRNQICFEKVDIGLFSFIKI